MTRYDYDGAAEPMKIDPVERKGSEFQVGAPTLFRHPQQNHAAVRSGGYLRRSANPLSAVMIQRRSPWINDQRILSGIPCQPCSTTVTVSWPRAINRSATCRGRSSSSLTRAISGSHRHKEE